MSLATEAAEAKDKSSTRLENENARLKQENQLLKTSLEHHQELLSKRPKIFRIGKEQKADGTWYRVIVPDSHGSAIDEVAAAAFLRDLEYLKPREVVWIGDHLDCGGFLAQHHVWGYVAEAAYTFADDCHLANAFLDAVSERCQAAKHYFIEGNHERRIERWCVTEALRNGKDAQFLKDKLGVATSLHLEKRGFQHFEQGKCYCGFRVPATIRLGKCIFTHGDVNSVDPAPKMLAKYNDNVIFGHNHTGSEVSKVILDRDVMAACVKSLCKRQPMWKHTSPSTWSLGYGVQIVRKNQMFLHITVPIIDGKSLLGPLLGKVL